MHNVSDQFLLQMAEISAGLIGLFLIGVFFYVESAGSRSDATTSLVDHYFRASTRIVLILFAIPIGISLSLVVMTPAWPRLLFVLLSAALVVANVDTAARVRAVARITGARILPLTEISGTLAVAVTVVLPWILGGLHPGREDLAWAILASFAAGCLSIYAVAMSAFDISRSRRDV